MRLWYGRIAASLVGGMITGLMGLVLVGCDAPDIVPVAPPGAPNPRTSPDSDASQAQGEMAAPALKTESTPTKTVEYTPATPTAKNETKTTKSGIKYETLADGSGPELKPGQSAQFLYVAKLENGKVIDDRTRKANRPEIIQVLPDTGPGLKAWQEALPGMKVGETRKMIIPPAMGYGEKGQPPEIPPNATLIYEVELVKIIGN